VAGIEQLLSLHKFRARFGSPSPSYEQKGKNDITHAAWDPHRYEEYRENEQQ